MQKKKQLSRKDFDNRIKIWTVLIPLVTCVIGSLTTIGITYLSNRTKVEYKIKEDDQLEINKLSAQINLLSRKYFQATDQFEKEKLSAELDVLAQSEASMMRKGFVA